jgi:DinB superfamily
MDAREFFLIHHAQVHSQVAREFLQDLSDEQMRLRSNGLNSVAWLVWHMARCEDALNVLIANRPQILDQNDWLTRLNLSLRDVGTGMTDDEVSDLSARLDLGPSASITMQSDEAPLRSSSRSTRLRAGGLASSGSDTIKCIEAKH